MKTIRLFVLWLCCQMCVGVQAQLFAKQQHFTRQDTLRGSITPERAWWDVMYYGVTVTPDYNSKTITGKTQLQFRVLQDGELMQIDLQLPMQLLSVQWNNSDLGFTRDSNIFLIRFPAALRKGTVHSLTLSFSGKPREAIRPPWDGGWIWKKDQNGRPWMSVACQGLGASAWFPCKDHQSDEPDSAALTLIVPDSLIGVGNGRLRSKTINNNGTTTYTWAVKNPINSYEIIPYIGKYVNWNETIDGEKGRLDCSYWVLDYNLGKATRQFKQAPVMLKCFEEWFGPYPFYEDSYKLVESPHLGMEHQSAIAYGNRFGNGYLGNDLSNTGWGLKWDYIIIHESGHEWFGNNITAKDAADMWIHESFTDYSETIYTAAQSGLEAGNDYVIGLRKTIANKEPIIGTYGVNKEGSGDMYNKGANMIHTIRQVINNDKAFKAILRGLNQTFYHQTVTASQVQDYISNQSHVDFSKVFEQYLLQTQIPVLEYRTEGKMLAYRWANCVKGFNMPVKISVNGEKWIKPTEQWQSLNANGMQELKADRNFYIYTRKVVE